MYCATLYLFFIEMMAGQIGQIGWKSIEMMPKVTCAGLKGRCFLKLKSVLLEVGYIEKWPKFTYLESKVPHLKFRVMRDRV